MILRRTAACTLALVLVLVAAGCGSDAETPAPAPPALGVAGGATAVPGGGEGAPPLPQGSLRGPSPDATSAAFAPPPVGTPAPRSNPPLPGSGVAPEMPPAPAPDLKAMRREVESTVAANPQRYDIRMQAATFYMQVGDNAAAIPHLQAATRLSPAQALPWIALGDAGTLSARFPVAEGAYSRAAKLEPDNPLLIRGRGQLYLAQERFVEARAELERGLKKHPDNPDLRVALGNLYLVLNRPRLAVKTLEPAVQRVPDSVELHSLLADAYERDLHLEAAVRELREVTRLAPQDHRAWGHIGLYLVNLTRFDDARPALERAIALDPAESYYYGTLADSYALDRSHPENFSRAEELFKKAIQLNPKNDRALYAYAMGLTRRGGRGDLDAAVGLLRRLLALNKKNVNVHFKLSETYRRLGKPAEARRHLASFQELSASERAQTRRLVTSASFEDTAAAHLKLGQEHLLKGNAAFAAREFELALERNPNLPAAKVGLERARAAGATSAENPSR